MTENNILMNWTDEFLIERLELTRVWKTLDNGFIIQELRPDKIDEVVEMIKEYYIVEEPLMFGSQMYEDYESVEQYLYLVRHWMMDTQSTVVVEQETGNVIGFLICRYNELSSKDPELSREKIYEGNTWTKLNKFKHYLIKKHNAYEHYNVDKVLEVYSWFVLPDYRRRGIGSELLKNVLQRQLLEYEIDVVTGMFTSKTSQQIAESLGMKTLYTFVYAEWTVNNEETREAEKLFLQVEPNDHSVRIMSTRIHAEDQFQQTSVANA